MQLLLKITGSTPKAIVGTSLSFYCLIVVQMHPLQVDPGVKYTFHEQAVAINTEQRHLCEIGNIEQHVVVTPDVDAMLEESKK